MYAEKPIHVAAVRQNAFFSACLAEVGGIRAGLATPVKVHPYRCIKLVIYHACILKKQCLLVTMNVQLHIGQLKADPRT